MGEKNKFGLLSLDKIEFYDIKTGESIGELSDLLDLQPIIIEQGSDKYGNKTENAQK